MDENIELDNLGDVPEEEEEGVEETNTDWDKSVVIMSGFNPEIRQGLEEEKQADRELGKIQGVRNRGYTEDKKNLLKELGISLNKGDGPFAKSIFEKLKITLNSKGKINGAEFDNVRIIVQRGKRLVYTEDAKKLAKVTEFKELVDKAELEHQKTPAALIEETLPDIPVNTNLEQAVVRDSVENLEHFIDEKVAEIEAKAKKIEHKSATIGYQKIREFRGVLDMAGHNLDNGALKTQEMEFRDAKNKAKTLEEKELYEGMIKVCVLKADEIRLRRNERPESEAVQSMVEEEAQQNDLTRFERFKQWAKKNLGNISLAAISVAGIITTIVMGARTAIKKGAQATSKFARALAKVGAKVAPIIGNLLGLVAKLLTLGASAVGFLAKNLWLLAVAIAYILYEKYKKKKLLNK